MVGSNHFFNRFNRRGLNPVDLVDDKQGRGLDLLFEGSKGVVSVHEIFGIDDTDLLFKTKPVLKYGQLQIFF